MLVVFCRPALNMYLEVLILVLQSSLTAFTLDHRICRWSSLYYPFTSANAHKCYLVQLPTRIFMSGILAL